MKKPSPSAYKPPYTLTDKVVSLVSEITETTTHLELRQSAIDPLLRKKNRLRTIHSSLAIEQNTLTLQQVTDIIDGRRVFGPPREIQEVKNAKAAYALIDKVRPASVQDLLKVHGLMTAGLTEQAGRFRTVAVGVFDGDGRLVHPGTPAELVPGQIRDLLSWVATSGVHPLVSSCVFHYEFEFIHPFTDGNGRMGRYWQTVLLAAWRPQMAWVPVEEVVRSRQQDYYRAIQQSDAIADAHPFIEYMLEAIRDALEGVKASVGENVAKSVVKILDAIRADPAITRVRLAGEVGLSVRGVERNLALLKKDGRLRRIGPNKGGHWQVVD